MESTSLIGLFEEKEAGQGVYPYDSEKKAALTKVVSANSIVPKVLDGEAFCDLFGLHPKVFEA